jgi:competence ComEA-like helix-hairpin-helix protein
VNPIDRPDRSTTARRWLYDRRQGATLGLLVACLATWNLSVGQGGLLLPDPPPQAGSAADVLLDRIDLNAAPAEVLRVLPGLGPARAQAIIESRREAGPFASPRDLQRVHGIGPAIAAALAPHVYFGSQAPRRELSTDSAVTPGDLAEPSRPEK